MPAPADGLSEAAVARITEAVTSAGYTADQLRVIEIRSGSPALEDGTDVSSAAPEDETDVSSASPEDGEALMELTQAPEG